MPECEAEVLLDLRSEDSLIEPGLSSALAARLHDAAVQASHDAVATAITRLFGRLDCPERDSRFAVAERLAGVSYE